MTVKKIENFILSKNDLTKILKITDPFILLDKVEKVIPGKNGTGIKNLAGDEWFFKCHFITDPVMPGCLGLDAMWQLLGFYLLWSGLPGVGRALGAENVKFFGQVLPSAKEVRYKVDIKRVINRGAILGLADGEMFVDNKKIYSADKLKVGLFKDPSNF